MKKVRTLRDRYYPQILANMEILELMMKYRMIPKDKIDDMIKMAHAQNLMNEKFALLNYASQVQHWENLGDSMGPEFEL